MPQLVNFFEAAGSQAKPAGKPSKAQPAGGAKQVQPSDPAADDPPEDGNASAIAAAQYALPMTDGETDQDVSDADEAAAGQELPSIRTNGAQPAALSMACFVGNFPLVQHCLEQAQAQS